MKPRYESVLGKRAKTQDLYVKEKTLLSEQTPATIGFEIEQCVFMGVAPEIKVQMTRGVGPRAETVLVDVDTYFKDYDVDRKSIKAIRDDAYDQFVAACKAGGIFLDVDNLNNKNHYFLELTTDPVLMMSDEVRNHFSNLSGMFTSFYTWVAKHRNIQEKQVFSINDWIAQTKDTFPADMRLSVSDEQGPFISSKRAKDVQFVAVFEEGVESRPIFLVQTNLSVRLEEMYSLRMREAFPILEKPIEPNDKANALGYKPWPEANPSAAFLKWEAELYENMHKNAEDFVQEHFSQLNDYSRARLAGMFRTYLYSITISLYSESGLMEEHFPNEQCCTDYSKGFFVRGYPKLSFDCLTDDCLTKEEKQVLEDFFVEEGNADKALQLFEKTVTESHLDTKNPFYLGNESGEVKFHLKDFVQEGLLDQFNPYRPKNGISLSSKPLDEKLPKVVVNGEIVRVPVQEFRVPKGNYCNAQDLTAMVDEQVRRASEFSAQAWENAKAMSPEQENPSPPPRKKRK